MNSRTAKNPIPALGGFNPDYYAETASIAENINGSSSSSRPQRPSREYNNTSSGGGQGRPSRPPQPPPSPSPSYNPPPQRPHSSSGAYQQPPPQQQQHAPQESGYGPTLTVPNASPSPGYYAATFASPAYPLSKPSQSQSQNYDNDNNYTPPRPPRPSSATTNNNNANDNSSSSSLKTSLSERLHQWGVKAGVPINKLTNKLGSEAFWPSTMDQECDKAARILLSFCKDGFYKTPTNLSTSSNSPAQQQKALVKIPRSVIASAHGLAIFTTFRTGLHISGAGGSGIIISRLPGSSKEWSPPSGFLVHTLGAGLMVGLDIYDCVCVLRTREAVRAFMRPGRLSLGGELALAAGPVGFGTSVEAAVGADSKPVWSYMKSRGFYAGIQVDGTVVVARPDANAAFYGARLTPGEILRGDVPSPNKKDGRGGKDDPTMWPRGADRLMEALRIAEGKGNKEGIGMRGGGGGGMERRLPPAFSSSADLGTGGRERSRGVDGGDGGDDYEYERSRRRNKGGERKDDDREYRYERSTTTATDKRRERSRPRERSGVDDDYEYEREKSRRERERSSRRSDRRDDDEYDRERSRREGSRLGDRRERY